MVTLTPFGNKVKNAPLPFRISGLKSNPRDTRPAMGNLGLFIGEIRKILNLKFVYF